MVAVLIEQVQFMCPKVSTRKNLRILELCQKTVAVPLSDRYQG